MIGDECSGICLFKVIVSKSQADSQYTINLLLVKLMTRITYIMESFGNNIVNFNKEIRYIKTALLACVEDPGNLLPHLFTAYVYYS